MGGTSARARLTLTLSSSNQQCDARRFHANDKSEREERGRDSSQSSMRLPFGWWFACPSPRAERRRVRQHTSPQLPPGIGRRKRMNTSAGRRQSAGLTSRSPRLRAGLVAHRVRWRRPSCALSPPRMPAAQNQARPSHRRPAGSPCTAAARPRRRCRRRGCAGAARCRRAPPAWRARESDRTSARARGKTARRQQARRTRATAGGSGLRQHTIVNG